MSDADISIHFSLTSSPSTPRITKTINKATKASELRVIAANATEIPIGSLKLIFRGRIIQNDDKAISEYSIEDDCVIHCLGKPVKESASASITTSSSTSAGSTLPAATASPPTSSSGSSTALTVEAALQTLKSRNDATVYSTALNTLAKVVSNILSNPNEEKYRKVKQSNAAFGRRLGNIPGGRDAMFAVGFISETPEGMNELHFVLKPNADAWNHLLESKTKIDSEVEKNKRNQNIPPPAPTFPSTPSFPATGSFGGAGGMPGMPGMPPMNPAMQEQMANMMSDPNMLRNMLQNPIVRQAMQSDPRVANNPMLRQALNDPNTINQISQMMSDPMVRQMMTNPTMMQSMMNSMPNMGGMGSNMNSGSSQPPTQPDPAAFARMMQGFSQMQNAANRSSNANSQQSQQQPSSNTNSGNNSGGDQEMTEEEMIAEAIARSLRDP